MDTANPLEIYPYFFLSRFKIKSPEGPGKFQSHGKHICIALASLNMTLQRTFIQYKNNEYNVWGYLMKVLHSLQTFSLASGMKMFVTVFG